MTTRESDARPEIEEVNQLGGETGQIPGRWVYRNVVTGEEMKEDHVHFVREGGKLRHIKAPPPLTAQEQQSAADTLVGLAENSEVHYPGLVGSMLSRPDTLWLLPEVQLMLSEKPSEPSYHLTSDLVQSALENPATPGTLAIYQGKTKHGDTQQLFWHEVGNAYGEDERDAFITTLAQLSEDGADNVASLALAWSEERDLSDPGVRENLLINLHQWAFQRQQFELGQTGFLGGLDAPQEIVEGLARGAVDIGVGLFGSAEDAARRHGLTLGQQLAYQFGVRPPDDAGSFGAWNNISGAADAISEIGLDPLAWIAGVGAGAKAAKTIPLAAKATKSGRLAMAARAMLPKWFSGATRGVSGGRSARVLYSFTSKSYDELMDGLAKAPGPGMRSVADDVLRIVKENNPSELQRRYPQLAKMTDEMWNAISDVAETPEEVVQVLKAGALNDAIRSGTRLDDAEKAAAEGWAAYGKAVEESARRQGDDVAEVTGLQGPELLNATDEIVHHDLAMEAVKRQLQLDTLKAKPSHAFIVSDIPTKPKKVAWNTVMGNVKSPGRVGRGVRSAVARVTPGRPNDEIELFNTRKAMVQLRDLFEHFGMRQQKVDELLNGFLDTELGARQDWLWEVAMKELGTEIGVPVLQHNLVSFYKGGGIRKFSGANLDMWVDAGGKAHRAPLLPSHMSSKVPVPLAEIEQIVRRAKSIQNRSKLSRAIGWNGRGLGYRHDSSKVRRAQLVRRFRDKLRDKGEEVDDLTDDDLWDMAYSYVSSSGLDGRGWGTAKMLPTAGSGWNSLHRAFTKSMLIFRPIQWMWRVAILEEPIRAHMFNMPSLYTNPLEYMGAAREAHYLSKLKGWREANIGWANDAYRSLTRGSRSADELTETLKANRLYDDIFPEGAPASYGKMKEQTLRFVEDAVYGRTRLNKLAPIKRVGWAVRQRAGNIKKAEGMLKKLGMPEDFDLVDDLPEIQNTLMRGYLAGTVGATDVKAYQWAEAMTDDQAFTYGQAYGSKLVEFVEDVYGRVALRRLVANLRGVDPPPAVSAEAIVNNSRWELMRPDLQRRFPEVTDDVTLANRYMDELLEAEAEHLFEPFLVGKADTEAADLLESFVKTRRLETDIAGQAVDIDLRSANYGDGTRAMGDLVQDMSGRPVEFPREIAAPSFDPRFLAGQVKKTIPDKILQFFGEGATQHLNRRPAFVREYNRWLKSYTKIGVPEEVAQGMARDHAAQMVNYVFFNMEEAPWVAEKLNRVIPFFGATYEVLSAWTYKMPVAVGGTWPTGIGEFGRKFRRLMDAFVNTGIVTREEQGDGSISHTLNLVPSDDVRHPNELGQFFRGAGHAAINTFESTIATILGMEDGMGLRDEGYRLTVGDPINLQDYGILSFAQFHTGLNPVANLAVTALAGMFPGAADSERTVPLAGGETLAEMADRLNVDVAELVRLNRGAFVDTDTLGNEVYTAVLAGTLSPEDVSLPAGLPIEVPETDVWSNVLQDIVQPFGDVDDLGELGLNFVPGALRWGLAGLGLQSQPTDEFWKGDYEGVFAGFIGKVGRAQVSAQISEAFMYVETHNVVNGQGPFARLQAKHEKLSDALAKGDTALANTLKTEIELDEANFLEKVQKTAAESLLLRSLTGQMLPTSPGHVRQEHELIQSFWNSRDYADSLKAGDGKLVIQPFTSMTELDNFNEQVAAWLEDGTGDAARGRFRENHPQLMAYLTPKTYYAEAGVPPEITSYEQYQDQIESGERIVAPLHVTMARAQSSVIQADYYNDFIDKFGNSPQQAAANALHDRDVYNELQDERNLAYQALYMWDDMHGGVYDQWQQERRQDDDWALERVVDNLNTIRDNLGIALELEDTLDIELDLDGISGLNTSLKAAIAEISQAIRDYDELTEDTGFRNPYEEAINQYFKEVYIPYNEGLTALYDELGERPDSERQSLMFEKIKLYNNSYSGTEFYLNDDTTIPFPSPLDWKWAGRTEEERKVKRQQWLTRPLEWIDQDSTARIIENAPHMRGFLPVTDEEFNPYREWTLARVQIDEALEDNTITPGEATKMRKALDEDLRTRLITEGRHGEVVFMDLTPYEKLEVSQDLPAQLGVFGDMVRYYKEVLAANEVSAGSTVGRQIVAPLYDYAENLAYSNPNVMEQLLTTGENLLDKTTLDNILPWLFFDSRAER